MTDDLLQLHELAAFTRRDAEVQIRRRVQSAYIGNDTSLTRILGRYKFLIDTRDEGFGFHVLLDGFWEIWLTLFCARNLQPGMVAIDVGANCGYYTLMFAEFVGLEGSVLAIEPNPNAANLLRRSISLNGLSKQTTVRELALGDARSGTQRLYIPNGEPKNALVVSQDFAQDHHDGHVIDVPSGSLDDVCADYPRVDVIKIDAEGSEERIFAGMERTIRKHRPVIVMEINVARYQEPGAFVERLTKTYGGLSCVTFEGDARAITAQELLSERLGEDWLIVLSPRALP